MGQPLFVLALTCVCFVAREFMSLQGIPVPTASFNHLFSNYHLKGTRKIYKEMKNLYGD